MNLDYQDNREDFYKSIPKFGERPPETKRCLHCGVLIERKKKCRTSSWAQLKFCSYRCNRLNYKSGGVPSVPASKGKAVLDSFLSGR